MRRRRSVSSPLARQDVASPTPLGRTIPSPYHLSCICLYICLYIYITNYLSNEERTRKRIQETNKTDKTDKFEKQFSKMKKKIFLKIAYLICPIDPICPVLRNLPKLNFKPKMTYKNSHICLPIAYNIQVAKRRQEHEKEQSDDECECPWKKKYSRNMSKPFRVKRIWMLYFFDPILPYSKVCYYMRQIYIKNIALTYDQGILAQYHLTQSPTGLLSYDTQPVIINISPDIDPNWPTII